MSPGLHVGGALYSSEVALLIDCKPGTAGFILSPWRKGLPENKAKTEKVGPGDGETQVSEVIT